MSSNDRENNPPSDIKCENFRDEKDNGQGGIGGAGVANSSYMSLTLPQYQPRLVQPQIEETEQEYFLKAMNISLLQNLVLVQTVASISLVISQVLLYAIVIVTRHNYKVMDYVGVSLSGSVTFFFIACYLTWTTTRSPSTCNIPAALAFQISSMFSGIGILICGGIALAYSDQEIAGRILCSLIILAAVCVIVVGVLTSIQFYGLTSCSKREYKL